MALARGQRILGVRFGPWEPAEGTELPGIAGRTWYYRSCYLELDSVEVYELGPRSIGPARLPPKTTNDPEIDRCLPLTIADVLIDRYEELRVVFEDGTYFENAYLPGGNNLIHDRVADWTPEEQDEMQQSVIDGRAVRARSLI